MADEEAGARGTTGARRSTMPIWERYLLSVLVCCCVAMLRLSASPRTAVVEVKEYCKWEVFNATCRPTEVIFMHTARYGRMRFGRCMQEDHGSSGCSADVLTYLDRRCSGRHTCHMTIPDPILHGFHTCPKELIPYLEASYSCIPVRMGNSHTCVMFGGLPLSSDDGYLASITTRDSPVGSSDCPWIIEAQPGQVINVTGWAFDLASFDRGGRGQSASSEPCSSGRAKVIVEEGNRTLSFSSCPSDAYSPRQRHWSVVSKGHRVKIYIQAPTSGDDLDQSSSGQQIETSDATATVTGPHYLLRFTIVGCPDGVVLENGWFQRHSRDRAVVSCNHSGQTYYITCDHNRWLTDTINCSKATFLRSSHVVHRRRLLPGSLLTVVSIGIVLGIFIGFIILLAVLYCQSIERCTEATFRIGCHTKRPLLTEEGIRRYDKTLGCSDNNIVPSDQGQSSYLEFHCNRLCSCNFQYEHDQSSLQGSLTLYGSDDTVCSPVSKHLAAAGWIGKTEEIMYPLQRLTQSQGVASNSTIDLHRQQLSANVMVESSNDERDSTTSEGTAIDFFARRHSSTNTIDRISTSLQLADKISCEATSK